jgi:hypothetical protein
LKAYRLREVWGPSDFWARPDKLYFKVEVKSRRDAARPRVRHELMLPQAPVALRICEAALHLSGVGLLEYVLTSLSYPRVVVRL